MLVGLSPNTGPPIKFKSVAISSTFSSISRLNAIVHRPAPNDIDFRNRAARGSGGNGGLAAFGSIGVLLEESRHNSLKRLCVARVDPAGTAVCPNFLVCSLDISGMLSEEFGNRYVVRIVVIGQLTLDRIAVHENLAIWLALESTKYALHTLVSLTNRWSLVGYYFGRWYPNRV
jgi:hypothetical protein